MIGVYNYTVIATLVSAFLAVVGIRGVLDGNAFCAILCFMLSGLLDTFDGLIASTKKNRTQYQMKYGIQLDSLCDVIAFGVLPCFVGYGVGMKSWWYLPIFAIYLVGAVSRLAHFNVLEEERRKTTNERLKYYTGLPVTLSSVFLPVLCLLRYAFGDKFQYFFAIAMAIIGVLFISKIKIKKPSYKRVSILVVFCVLVFAAIIVLRVIYGY